VDKTFPYKAIEEWWGEPLSKELIERISSAPDEHIEEFFRFAESASRSKLLQPKPGMLRPLAKRSTSNLYRANTNLSYIDTALKLLLYSDEVAVEDPIHFLGGRGTKSMLTALLMAKPLADAGLVQFIRFPHTYEHPSRTHAFTGGLTDMIQDLPDGEEIVQEILRFTAKQHGYDLGAQVFAARWALGLSLLLAEESPGMFNMLLESTEETLLLPHGIFRAKQAAPDLRSLTLAKLAALNLPTLNAGSIWTVRRSSEEFAQWRTALAAAMRDIDIMSVDDEAWQSEAKNLVSAELRPIQEKLQKTVDRSPALSAMKVGVADLGYAAVGATSGALAGGKISTSLIGAVGAKGSQAIVNYLREVRTRRANKAVLDLVMSFYPDEA
jgi:hypothetical protein